MAVPLVLASSGHAIRLVADRIMLARYSQAAIAASMPAGLSCFVLMSFFIGTAGYVNTFVAQYSGAGQAVWQGLYLSLLGGLLIAILGETGEVLFALMGHAAEVQVQQVDYFRILCRLSAPGIMLATILGFWSGRGRTYVVMGVELLAAGMNILLNHALIFGRWGLPEMGITGAGAATGISNMVALLAALGLFFASSNRHRFGTWPHKTFNPAMLIRLLRFGIPNGMQFMLDLAAFNIFVVFLGRFGTEALEATNMAFGLNACSFIPLLGIGLTASILVGQCVGAGRIDVAQIAVRRCMLIALAYTIGLGVFLIFQPLLVLRMFQRGDDPGQAATIQMAVHFVRFIAVYLIFDAMYIVYHHAIKGAGDTRFAMFMGLAISWGTLVLPCVIAYKTGASIWTMWIIFVGHVILAGVLFYWRYRTGAWKNMRVIEPSPDTPETIAIEVP